MSGLMSVDLVGHAARRCGAGRPGARSSGSVSLVAPLLQSRWPRRRGPPCAGPGRSSRRPRPHPRTPRPRRRRTRRRGAAPRRPRSGLGPEVAAAGLAAVQGVDAHQLAELEEVGHPAGLLQALVEAVGRAEHACTLRQNSSRRPRIRSIALSRPSSERSMPQYSHMMWPSSLWKESTLRVAVDGQQPGRCAPRPTCGPRRPPGASAEIGVERALGQVVADRVGEHEVAVGQALHQRRGAEPVRAVVGEVGLAGDEQAGDRRLQVVVDPQAAHDVVHGGVDPHRHLVRVLAR